MQDNFFSDQNTPPTPVIPALQARRQFGELLNTSLYQGKSTIIERTGKLVAAVIPMQEFHALMKHKNQEAREGQQFLEDAQKFRKQYLTLSEEEIAALANDALLEE